MSPRTAPLRDRLATVDQKRAERQTRLIAALNARRLGELTLTARVALERDRRAASAWIRLRAGADEVAVAPLLVEAELVRLTTAGGGPDPAVAARLLGALEPLIVALESALGEDLHPQGLSAEPPANAILLRVDAVGPRHELRHRLIVAAPPDGEVAASALPPADGALLATLRARWTAAIDTPPIPARHLGTLAIGDLYLLGRTALVARVSLPGHRVVVRGRLEPQKGSMTLQEDLASAASEHATPDPTETSVDWELMTVPATIEIAGGLLSARDVAGLAAGSVLTVPQTGGTLSVRVVAGGAIIGAGELVAVGDGFGVLFTSVTGTTEAEG